VADMLRYLALAQRLFSSDANVRKAKAFQPQTRKIPEKSASSPIETGASSYLFDSNLKLTTRPGGRTRLLIPFLNQTRTRRRGDDSTDVLAKRSRQSARMIWKWNESVLNRHSLLQWVCFRSASTTPATPDKEPRAMERVLLLGHARNARDGTSWKRALSCLFHLLFQ
jgi:hypothetical protein